MAAESRKKRKKRRDSTCSLKPPLDFIESPVNGRKHYCTPVQAARRPFLAASMPVDDEVSMKWVSPQFPHKIENDENLLALLKPNKKSRGRRKKQENTQSAPEELTSNKHLFGELDFQCNNKVSIVGSKNVNENSKVSCRRSQRIRLKELKRTHFLFEVPQVATPVNRRGEVILAYETPDQELLNAVTHRQVTRKRGEITWS